VEAGCEGVHRNHRVDDIREHIGMIPAPAVGLALLALYGLLAVGLRMLAQLRRTGSTGFAGLRGTAPSVEWICGLLLVLAILLCIAGPTLQLTGR
jgi:hypothetical protein